MSVNFPIKYRNNRKLIHVKIAMAATWIVSAVIWAPWILFWQFLTKDGRTVKPDNCYIQFIWDSKLMAIITAAGWLEKLNFYMIFWSTLPIFVNILGTTFYSETYLVAFVQTNKIGDLMYKAMKSHFYYPKTRVEKSLIQTVNVCHFVDSAK